MKESAAKGPFRSPILWALVLSACCIELILQGADLGLWGSARLRQFTYQNTAFWPGLLTGWKPNYPSQPVLMFLTYAFVHTGLVHLLVNMIALILLGGAVIQEVGQLRFLIIYIMSALVGAIVFVLLTTSFRPMVGASGALFGLTGAMMLWNTLYALRSDQSSMTKVLSIVWLLCVLIVLMLVGFDKSVAWETHLGGFLGGLFAAAFMINTAIADEDA